MFRDLLYALAGFLQTFGQLQLFFLVFIRLAAIVAFMPVFSSKTLPLIFKAGLTFAASFLLFPILDLPVIDHIIIGDDSYFSFADEGLL